MNPRVSRSSALASKATGFPIAKIAAKLAVGYTLDEIRNDITRKTPAALRADAGLRRGQDPAVRVREVPRRRPGADHAHEERRRGDGDRPQLHRGAAARRCARWRPRRPASGPTPDDRRSTVDELLARAARARPTAGSTRVERALRAGATVEQVARGHRHRPVVPRPDRADRRAAAPRCVDAPTLTPALLRQAKRHGLSDRQIAALRPELAGEDGVRALRHRARHPSGLQDGRHLRGRVRRHARRTTTRPTTRRPRSRRSRTAPKVIILGSGPNRIGQGIEFDYSCVHAVMALRDGRLRDRDGQLQPRDGVDRLRHRRPAVLRAADLRGRARGRARRAGSPAPSPASSARSAGRPRSAWPSGSRTPACRCWAPSPRRSTWPRTAARSAGCSPRPGCPRPSTAPPTSFDEAKAVADEIGYPVLVRPSYVLGGRGMEIVYDEAHLSDYIARATEITADHPVLVDRFLDDAVEIDVDALYDGTELYLGGVMEHIEEAGIHSGDSACALPPITLGRGDIDDGPPRRRWRSPQGVGVRGLLNVQYALAGDVLYVLEANPRASRTVPFVSKATAVPLAKAAARIALGRDDRRAARRGLLPAAGDGGDLPADAPIAVKEAVLPFHRFRTPGRRPGRLDPRPGDEVDRRGDGLRRRPSAPRSPSRRPPPTARCRPRARCSSRVANRDKRAAIFPVKRLADLGFRMLATAGTAQVLRRNGVAAEVVGKFSDGAGQHRRADPGRRGRPGAEHARGARRQRAAAGRLRDPHRRGHRRHPVPDHRAGARPPRCRASRSSSAATSACARCRTCTRSWPSWRAGRGRA